jgi:hypothetical protein
MCTARTTGIFPLGANFLQCEPLTGAYTLGSLVMHRARRSRREGGQANGSRKATVREAPEPKAATGSVYFVWSPAPVGKLTET